MKTWLQPMSLKHYIIKKDLQRPMKNPAAIFLILHVISAMPLMGVRCVILKI